jgi:hypothetical protein
MKMSDEEIVAELYRIAHTWENHPIHSDLANTLREAARRLYAQAKPSSPSSGQLPHAPGDM